MSVKELRARVEKISDEIELQKKFLAKLLSDKSLVQRQLNAVLDPVARLPPEISSDIFLHCLSPVPALDLPPSDARGGPDPYLILLLTVCNLNAWTTMALSTPDLWTAIDIIFPCAEGFPEILETWLQRARNRPLSISLRGNFDDPSVPVIYAIIWKHGQQLRSLEICADTENEDTENEEEHGIGYVDLFLGMLKSGPLPLLQTLAIRGLLDESGLLGPLREFSGPQILELLSLAPNLMECIFHDVDCVSDLDPRPKNLILPNLRRLSFGPRTTIPSGDDGILRCLSVPRLEALSVSLSNLSANDLISFLERSSPPLQELVISDVSGLIHDIRFRDCLRLLPSLQRFEVWWPSNDLMRQLSAALEDSFLPKLRDLNIHNLSQLQHSFTPSTPVALNSRPFALR
jgi:hypothetical protein